MADKTLQEQFDELKAHHDGVMASLLRLQVDLDASLQREADLKAAQATALQELAAQHEATIAGLKAAAAAQLAALTTQLMEQHAAVIADLKEKTLLPALRDLQARQAADLAAQHAAQLASL